MGHHSDRKGRGFGSGTWDPLLARRAGLVNNRELREGSEVDSIDISPAQLKFNAVRGCTQSMRGSRDCRSLSFFSELAPVPGCRAKPIDLLSTPLATPALSVAEWLMPL